jgi:hypothetical protein
MRGNWIKESLKDVKGQGSKMEPKDSLTELQVGTDKQRGDDISWCFES